VLGGALSLASRKESTLQERYRIPVYKVQLVREPGPPCPGLEVRDPRTVIELMLRVLSGRKEKLLASLLLDSRARLIAIDILPDGVTRDRRADARTIFRAAILSNAYSIILVRTHPQGGPDPTESDIRTFETIALAGEAVGIKVHDALILGESWHYSARTGAYLDTPPENPSA
jgi:DNA repair protein RadC